jgi:hypothetical protein
MSYRVRRRRARLLPLDGPPTKLGSHSGPSHPSDVLERSAPLTLDESGALHLELPTRAVPESHGSIINLDNCRLKPDGSRFPEPSHSGLQEVSSETTPAMTGDDSQSVNGSSPTIPSGGDSPNEVVVALGDQKRFRIERKQPLQAWDVIRVGQFGLSGPP